MDLTPPVVLTIAGFDPSSGAGIASDIKTIAAHECYGVACITALTVQSTKGVRRVEGVDPALVTDILEELAADFTFAAIHIGMLANGGVVEAVAGFLERARVPHVVLDPVLKSSSGADLLDPAGARLLIERLVVLAEVVTPNVDEAGAMTGMAVTDIDQMQAAAVRLHSLGAANVVITGGHLAKATDLLSHTTGGRREQAVFEAERQVSNSTHGTGCAFATALACRLALGAGLVDAVRLAKEYVSGAIANAYPLGDGVGPVHHLYRRRNKHT